MKFTFWDALKGLLALGWMAFVAYAFYFGENNFYYYDALPAWKIALFHLVLMGAAGAALYFGSRKAHTVRLPAVLALLLVTVFLIASYQFFRSDYSTVTGGTLVKEGTTLSLVPTGTEPSSTQEVIFYEGEIVTDTSFVLNNLPPQAQQIFDRAGYFESMAHFGQFVLLGALAMLGFFVIFSGLGAAIFYRRKKDLDWEERCISYFLGAAAFSFSIFVLVWAQSYTVASFVGVLALAILLAWRQIWDSIRALWSTRISLKKNSAEFFVLLSVGTVFFAMAILDLIRPFPLAWDDINLYMRAAKLMAEANVFPRGIGPVAWTGLQSIPWLFVKTMWGSMTLLIVTYLAGLPLVYAFARRFLSERISLLATGFLLWIPMIIFFLVIDSKIEIPLMLTGLAASVAWLKWLESGEKRDLVAAAVLLGFALTIKITALILLAVMLLATLYVKAKKWILPAALFSLFLAYFGLSDQMATLNAFEISSKTVGIIFAGVGLALLVLSAVKEKPWTWNKSVWTPALLVLGISALSFLPWMALHYYETPSLDFSNLIFGQKGIPQFSSEFSGACTAEPLSFVADYKRYSGPGAGLSALLAFPWNAIMTPALPSFISDISFLFLGILPTWVLFPSRTWNRDKKIRLLFVAFWAMALLWFFLSSGVMWYGIFLLVPGIVLLFSLFEENSKIWKGALGVFVALAVIASFLLRNHMFVEQRMFAYALGVINAEETLDHFYPGFDGVVAALNDYKKQNEEPVVYRVGSQIKFFLPTPDTKIHDDDFLDDFICLAQGKDTETIKAAFKAAGITHILFHRGSALTGESQFEEAYAAQRNSFDRFLQDSGWPILYAESSIVLLEVQ